MSFWKRFLDNVSFHELDYLSDADYVSGALTVKRRYDFCEEVLVFAGSHLWYRQLFESELHSLLFKQHRLDDPSCTQPRYLSCKLDNYLSNTHPTNQHELMIVFGVRWWRNICINSWCTTGRVILFIATNRCNFFAQEFNNYLRICELQYRVC